MCGSNSTGKGPEAELGLWSEQRGQSEETGDREGTKGHTHRALYTTKKTLSFTVYEMQDLLSVLSREGT